VFNNTANFVKNGSEIQTYQRGELLGLQWQRSNSSGRPSFNFSLFLVFKICLTNPLTIGGFVRIAIVPIQRSNSFDEFNKNVLKIMCFETTW
jgi:hypothetical protein